VPTIKRDGASGTFLSTGTKGGLELGWLEQQFIKPMQENPLIFS